MSSWTRATDSHVHNALATYVLSMIIAIQMTTFDFRGIETRVSYRINTTATNTTATSNNNNDDEMNK